MRHAHPLISSVMFAGALLCASVARANEAPKGVWIDDQGRGGIEITDCSGKLCGHLVWFKDAEDVKNCGKQILGDVAPAGPNTWDNGWIYSPEKKQRFDVELKPLSADKLQVMGYAGMKFLSKTMIWTRAPADLARCNAIKADTNAAAPSAKAESSPAPAAQPEEQSAAASPPEEAAAPAGEEETAPPRSKRTARAEAVPSGDAPRKPRRESRNDDGDNDGPLTRDNKGNCTLNVPYVTLNFPCKD